MLLYRDMSDNNDEASVKGRLGAVGACMTCPVACTRIQIKGTFNSNIYSKFSYQIGLKGISSRPWDKSCNYPWF